MLKWIANEIHDMSSLEWLGLVLTIIAVVYYMSWYGWTLKAMALTSLMVVFGFMAGSMLYDLWR